MANKTMAAQHDRRILPNRGMTLIEVLVTLSVLAILLAVGVPAFNQFVVSSRLSAYSSDMLSTRGRNKANACATVSRKAEVSGCTVN